ncbi:MAG: flavodoxin family protein [Pseudomonadota bacterium]
MRIAVVYFSGTGTTAALAEAAAEGAEATLHRIQGSDIIEGRYRATAALEAIDAAPAVIFGSPTYMGGPAAEFKAFADASSDRWSVQGWAGKLAAGLTSGGYPNGDQGATLGYFQVLAAQHGMLWCGLDAVGVEEGVNRFGCQAGATAVGKVGVPDPADLETARALGCRIASLAARLG